MTPTAAYVVCTTPRTGSGLLGEALWKTGIAGEPDEYFNAATAREYMTAWGVTDSERYVDTMLERATTPNGVFGLKLMADQLPRLGSWLPEVRGRDVFAGLDVLAARLPSVRWIMLTRRDRVRQAISYWKALHADAFASTDAGTDNSLLLAAFDPSAVDRLLAEIDRGNVAWRTYFRERTITPVPLVYEEDLQEGFETGVATVLGALGVTLPADSRIDPGRRPQADAVSELLHERYRASR